MDRLWAFATILSECPLLGSAIPSYNVRNGRIVLKNSVGSSAGQISSKSRKLASSNISDLAWRPTRKTRLGNSKFALAGLFQHNRREADIAQVTSKSLLCAEVLVGRPRTSTGLEPLSRFLTRPTLPAQCLILGDLSNALRLLAAHLNRRDLVAIGDPARYLLTSGLDFL